MNDELERIWKEVMVALCLPAGIDENKKSISQESRCSGRDANRVPP
jgi:hypothetical protein